MKKVISVVGARPNFMKVAPLHKAFKKFESDIAHLICHTGQHYDREMSKLFFEELELPQPDFYLGVGSGSHAQQTAKIMMKFEEVLLAEKPDLVIVVGDVNSTIACSLVASKLGIRIAHVEAGLRSFDRSMPEEINRLLTDSIADYLFVTEQSGMENLKREGIPDDKVFFVGNVMIDSLVYYLPKARESDALQRYQLTKSKYVVVTFHRPSNVDACEGLTNIVNLLNLLSEKAAVIFPVHPRTRANLQAFALDAAVGPRVQLTNPIGYIDFLSLARDAALIITDSGGIQEETTYLGIPCITLRQSTERPVTVQLGTNHLLGTDFGLVAKVAHDILNGRLKSGRIPELWDGKAGERIAEILVNKLMAPAT